MNIAKKKISAEEFLLRFCKENKLYPMVMVVFCFGEKEWDACYKINLIDVSRLDNLVLFHPGLQVILGLLKWRIDKQKLKKYVIDHKEFFENVDLETEMVISIFMNSESIINNMER